MYGKLHSACLYGIDGMLIEVETDLSNGLPLTAIIGLPDSAIREAVERVRAAIKNCGYQYPLQRITINLAPADLRKEGSSFDLAIAIALLVTSGQLVLPAEERTLIVGELALDGSVRPVPGVVAMVDLAKRQGFTSVILPADNLAEGSLISGIQVHGIRHLRHIAPNAHESGSEDRGTTPDAGPVALHNYAHLESPANGTGPMDFGQHAASAALRDDYADVLGQHHAKRALMIAAAGMHNIMVFDTKSWLYVFFQTELYCFSYTWNIFIITIKSYIDHWFVLIISPNNYLIYHFKYFVFIVNLLDL